VMLAMLWPSLERAPMQLGLLKQGDWTGVATLAIALGALETVLEEGNKDDWFGSTFILRLSLAAAVALPLFVWRELAAAKPLLNLRLLLRRNFGFGTLANFMLGAALYGSSFILPLYLSQVQGYNAEQIGEVLMWYGMPQLLLIPLVPRMLKVVDARLLVALGTALFAASNFMNIDLSADVGGDQLFWANIVRAIGQAVILAPLGAIATAGIEAENAASASGLFNMTRNLGGAIGIATLQDFLTKREQFHSNIITAAVSPFAEATQRRIARLSDYLMAHALADPARARHEAIVAIGRIVHRQASVMAYGDTFYLLGVMLVIAVLATLCLRRGESGSGGAAH
jgi:MFS transporter, DHA2 family, multidrug resistance protein